jgi:3D-(3,5/4)-trihydroxycyclohexane-1,2-dione acylhydrolase (decyclizing)
MQAIPAHSCQKLSRAIQQQRRRLVVQEIHDRARTIAQSGGLNAALSAGLLPEFADVSLSESVILGLLRQNVTKFLGILGHGSTTFGEILRIYSEAGALRFYACRSEIAMAHAATALAWIFDETPAVVTSIGPGALQAMAASLAAASNGIGVYHIYGSGTTHGEGYNMQQLPDRRQDQFGRLLETMGHAFTLHTPAAVREAMRRGTAAVHRPYFATPFYLSLPINVQSQLHRLRLESLPLRLSAAIAAPIANEPYDSALDLIARHRRIVIKAGGGTRRFPETISTLADALGAVVVLSPGSLGVLPDAHPRNMHVGGSKGTISGNFAMETADLVVVIGSRAVCQADCSGTGYPVAEAVININGNIEDASHYNRTVMLNGDIGAIIKRLLSTMQARKLTLATDKDWIRQCAARKAEWSALKAERCADNCIFDPAWNKSILTQPGAVRVVAEFAKSIGAVKVFDAGDVQANGFQVAEDDAPDASVSEAGSSYMGFAASALLASAIADRPRYMIAFSGDGSFVMNPQILVDAVTHGVRGTLVVFDNRRMAAISSLQCAQYGRDFGTNDSVAIDFVAFARAVTGVNAFFGGHSGEELRTALGKAYETGGFSLVHVPVYWGEHPSGGMGTYGRWNVGPWSEAVQTLYNEQRI